MPDQLTEAQFNDVLARVMQSAPEGLTEEQFNTLLDAEVRRATTARSDMTQFGPLQQLYREQADPQGTRERSRQNAPSIGAMALAPMGGPLVAPLLAAAGGTGGALVRGDAPMDAMIEGGKQGLIEGATRAVKPLVQLFARGTMRGAVPRHIAAEFDNVDIAQEALNRGAVPGSTRSANTVGAASEQANKARDTIAGTIPRVSGGPGLHALTEMYDEAIAAKMPERAADILKRGQQVFTETGGGSMTGRGALARKDILQAEAKAAVNSPTGRTGALEPQLKNAERGAIVQELRKTPGMGEALDESQKLMALDRVMQAQKGSNLVNRARQGGMGSAALSPLGLSMTAHGINAATRALDPNLVRLLDALMSQRSGAPQE